MTSLKKFHGLWKQCDSTNDSEAMKAMGIGKTKRRILKKLKVKIKYDVQSDTKVICTNKTFRETETIELDVAKKFNSDLGETENLHKLEGNSLVSYLTMIKPSNNCNKMVAGDKIISKATINDKNQLCYTIEVKGVTCTKKFKYKGGAEADDGDDDDAENEKLRKMAQEAEHDEGDDE